MRFSVDSSWQRFGRTVIAGSPLSTFRLTEAGEEVARTIEVGAAVAPSRLVDRLLDTGSIHPIVAANRAMFTLDDVTVVTPQLGGTAGGGDRIIVDDGSSPPIDGATLRLDVTAGPAAARNAGRELVATPLVAFVDSDVDTLDEIGAGDWMANLLGHFDDPRVGLVAPRVCGEPGSQLDLGAEPGRIRVGSRVSYVPAAAIIVRAAALDQVGGFDETLRYGEDVDLVWRLDQAGWRCRYDPGTVVWHEPRPTLVARMRQHATYGSSAAPLALRHPGALAPFRSNGWTATSWVLAGLGHPITGLLLAVGSAFALVRKLPDVPPAVSVRLAMTGHLRAAEQVAAAVRRAWWPIVVIGAVRSKRLRWLALAALAFRPRSASDDLAYGWGLWRGMLATRTIAPIVPSISSWPPRSARARRSAVTVRSPDEAAR